jgi:hypothetical protein
MGPLISRFNNVVIDGISLNIRSTTAPAVRFADRTATRRSTVAGMALPAVNCRPYRSATRAYRRSYSNGRTIDLAEITLATFSGANMLKRSDGGAFEATAESGTATYGAPGKIIGSSLEGSNTDIADEFTKLIVTQQAYSANTKVITTSNTMVQDLLNVLR